MTFKIKLFRVSLMSLNFITSKWWCLQITRLWDTRDKTTAEPTWNSSVTGHSKSFCTDTWCFTLFLRIMTGRGERREVVQGSELSQVSSLLIHPKQRHHVLYSFNWETSQTWYSSQPDGIDSLKEVNMSQDQLLFFAIVLVYYSYLIRRFSEVGLHVGSSATTWLFLYISFPNTEGKTV